MIWSHNSHYLRLRENIVAKKDFWANVSWHQNTWVQIKWQIWVAADIGEDERLDGMDGKFMKYWKQLNCVQCILCTTNSLDTLWYFEFDSWIWRNRWKSIWTQICFSNETRQALKRWIWDIISVRRQNWIGKTEMKGSSPKEVEDSPRTLKELPKSKQVFFGNLWLMFWSHFFGH